MLSDGLFDLVIPFHSLLACGVLLMIIVTIIATT
jgi:hypothetical protein